MSISQIEFLKRYKYPVFKNNIYFPEYDEFTGRFIACRHEDEADIYALEQIGIEKVKTGIVALKKLYKEEFLTYGIIEGYFRVHRTNSERIAYLTGISSTPHIT